MDFNVKKTMKRSQGNAGIKDHNSLFAPRGIVVERKNKKRGTTSRLPAHRPAHSSSSEVVIILILDSQS